MTEIRKIFGKWYFIFDIQLWDIPNCKRPVSAEKVGQSKKQRWNEFMQALYSTDEHWFSFTASVFVLPSGKQRDVQAFSMTEIK